MIWEINGQLLKGSFLFGFGVGFTLHHLVCNLGVEVPVEGVDGCLHGRDLFGLLVGDVEAEVLFHGHHQFHRVEGVEAQFFESGTLVEFRLVALGCTLEHLIDLGLNLFQEGHLSGVRG